MVSINWSLLGPPVDIGARFQEGMQQGRAIRIQQTRDSALSALGQDPSNPQAMSALAGVDPQTAAQFQEAARRRAEAERQSTLRAGLQGAYDPTTGRMDPVRARQAYVGVGDVESAMDFDAGLAKQRSAITESQREGIKFGARILEGVDTPEKYSAARAAYGRAGFDLTDVPEAFDPSYVQQVVQAGRALSGTAEEDEYTLNPGAIRYRGSQIVAQSPYAPTVTAEGVVYERQPMAGSGVVGSAPAGDVFQSLIQQESGGRPGIRGPVTQYGQPMGMTQMLPETAREMAQKVGLPWRPEMLSGTTPEAAEYQTRLGRAYYEEGLAKYGGDARKALMYYHGGPDERLWGPKTRAYADQVLARANGGSAASTGGVRAITPPKPAERPKPSETRVVKGKTYYKVNGRWFDNAEGA